MTPPRHLIISRMPDHPRTSGSRRLFSAEKHNRPRRPRAEKHDPDLRGPLGKQDRKKLSSEDEPKDLRL